MGVQNLPMPSPGGHPAAAMPGALHGALAAASQRIRLALLLKVVGYALPASSAIGIALVGLGKLRAIPEPSPWLTGGIVAVSLLGALVYAFARPLRTLDVARLTDQRTNLKDRLSSAVEFHAQGVDPNEPFYGEQMSDAVRHAEGVDLKAAYPMRIPRLFWLGVALAIGLCAAHFVPSLPAFWSPQKKQEVEEVKKTGIAIVKVAQDATKGAEQQDLKETKKAAQEAQKLGEAMQKAKMSKKESLVALQKLTKKMEEAQQKLADQQVRTMEQTRKAGQDFKKSLDQMQKEVQQKRQEEAQREAEQGKNAGQKPGEQNNANGDKNKQQQQSMASKQAQQAMQQMADALANMDKQQQQQAMKKLADALKSGKMSKEERKQVQKALKQLAQNLKQSGQQQQGQKMEQLADQMSSNSDNMDPQTLQQMAQMAENIGKEMGQSGKLDKDGLDEEALSKMADALKSGRMTMAMGKGGFGGNQPGSGFGGKGGPSKAMKDPGATNPRLVAKSNVGAGKGIGKTKSAEEFAKYAAMKNGPPKFLPNGQIKGARSKEGNELQITTTGDPEAFRSNTPYFQAYTSSRKQAENSLNKENIPIAYKKQVRDYFDTIKP